MLLRVGWGMLVGSGCCEVTAAAWVLTCSRWCGLRPTTWRLRPTPEGGCCAPSNSRPSPYGGCCMKPAARPPPEGGCCPPYIGLPPRSGCWPPPYRAARPPQGSVAAARPQGAGCRQRVAAGCGHAACRPSPKSGGWPPSGCAAHPPAPAACWPAVGAEWRRSSRLAPYLGRIDADTRPSLLVKAQPLVQHREYEECSRHA